MVTAQHPDRLPLSLCKPDAAQPPKVVERLGGIQLAQAKPGALLVQP